MAVKTLIENEILRHGWGAKGDAVELVPADTRTCPRTNSGRQSNPNTPCGYGSKAKERLLVHQTIRLPEGRPIECPSCGWLGVLAHPEAEHAVARAAVADGRVVRLDFTRGIYTLGDLMEWVGKLFPAMGLGSVHVELVGPDQATVPYEEPIEAAAPKSEVEELRDRLAAQDDRMAKLEALLAEKPKRKAPDSAPA